ncbi:unnamed protein product [Acanthoscelides obtectus]|uniref:Uncharacterized protein n=1 Tax=Acanthoscelides obtectus TaxID=200917 RepID=A0A9P0M5G1_ACAOB|nr:unnamed protein product [Acanthoscelides obtectus]CAK1658630.1 hypothetical protein AOBTE_LOCUS21036 [Acanthoscelides obtectus]
MVERELVAQTCRKRQAGCPMYYTPDGSPSQGWATCPAGVSKTPIVETGEHRVQDIDPGSTPLLEPGGFAGSDVV